jgi:hypothetical protein
LSTKVVDVSRVDVEPESVDVKIVLLEPFLEESIRGDVLKLLKSVDLREFVFDGKLIVRIDVSDELPLWTLGGEGQRLVETLKKHQSTA